MALSLGHRTSELGIDPLGHVWLVAGVSGKRRACSLSLMYNCKHPCQSYSITVDVQLKSRTMTSTLLPSELSELPTWALADQRRDGSGSGYNTGLLPRQILPQNIRDAFSSCIKKCVMSPFCRETLNQFTPSYPEFFLQSSTDLTWSPIPVETAREFLFLQAKTLQEGE